MNDEMKPSEQDCEGKNKGPKKSGCKPDRNRKKDWSKATKPDQQSVPRERRGKGGIPWKNDWRYYASSEEIAKQIASIPFNVMNGAGFNLQAVQTNSGNTGAGRISADVPAAAIMVLEYVPSIGVTSFRTDAINMAAVQLYSFVRHANAGAKNYEAADLMMYVLAMRDIYIGFFELKRALGITPVYNFYNHYMPQDILTALRIDPDDLRSNYSQYMGKLNILAEKINSFAVPKYFKAFERAAFVSSFLFSDSTSIRGQFYAFRKAGYYTWAPTANESGTQLTWTKYNDGPNLMKFSKYLEILEGQLDALFLDEDALTMSGDILKAFKETDLYGVQQTDYSYRVVPTFDEDVLAQIENAYCLRSVQDPQFQDLDVTQANQLIRFNPTLEKDTSLANDGFVMQSTIFNSHKDEPNYTDVLEWSRLIPTATSTLGKVTVTSCGLELLNSMRIWYRQVASDASTLEYWTINSVVRPTDPLTEETRGLELMQFDWHPFQYNVNNKGGTYTISFGGDVKVATLMEASVALNINKSANYASFYAEGLYSKATNQS